MKADYTYFGIGTCPPASVKITMASDQIIPAFLLDEIEEDPHARYQIIHYDPCFLNNPRISEYMAASRYGFIQQSPYHWKTLSVPSIDMKVNPYEFNYEGDILVSLIKEVLQTNKKAKLVVQDFTGKDIESYARSIYDEVSPQMKDQFRKQILFDITYGTDWGCQTDMTKYQPLLDASNDFFNPMLMSAEKQIKIVGKNRLLDKILLTRTVKQWKILLNDYHVDYRRRLRGEAVIKTCEFYDDKSEPAIIMDVLINELTALFYLLAELNPIIKYRELRFNELYEQYIEMDVYKWYSEMNSIVNLSHA
jgi:hypothetical protein